MFRGTKKLWAGATVAAMTFAGVAQSWAANGTWQGPSIDNDWDTTTNWVGGTIADGANFTANFTGPDLTTGGNIVTMNIAPHTIGNIVFSDSNLGTGVLGDNWDIQGANALTLSNTTQPTITVNNLHTDGVAIISTPLAGTQGFAKAGVGQLTIGNAVHTITGPVNVNAGTLRLDARIGGTTAVEIGGSQITLANGTTLIANTGAAAASAMHANNGRVFNVASGSTVNIRTINSVELGKFAAAGATLNFTLETAASTFTPSGDWNAANNAAGSPTVVNVSAPNGAAFFSPTFNNGSGNTDRNFDAAAGLVGTTVNLTNNTYFTGRTGSGGNTIQIGALTGDATTALVGGGAGGGTFLNYQIGALNSSTTFAGNVDMNLAPTPNPSTGVGGLSLTKVGTGTLTLSGMLNYQPTSNTTHNRRGGITSVNAGTLKLTGPAAILGGLDATNIATLRFSAGGTLDVSTVSTPASTAAFQQVIGVGTILGAYTHDEGLLAPGDTLNQTAAATTLTSVAGTLTFGGPLSFAGAGELKFNVSPSTVTGNDLIQVNGATSLTGNPTLTLGLIGGITTGQYTIVNSTGGFGATNASGWTVGWTGRGSAPALSIVGGTKLVLNVTPSNFGSLNWRGTADGLTWDVNGQANWHNNGTNAADKFFDNDSVTFGDAYGPGNTPVVNSSITVGTTVSPLNMVFNSNTVVYSITGAGKISGAASLVKTGNTLLTLQTANDFTGTASISGTGGVDIGAFPTALGTNTLTLTNTKLTTQGGIMSNSSMVLPAGSSSEITTQGAAMLTLPALSGDGNLLITNDAARGVDMGSTNDFTGDLTLGAPASANNMIVRMQGSSLASSKVTLNNVSLRDRATSAQIQTIGALEGDATSSLWGYQGGSTSTGRTWRIGSLNTSTTFHGLIQDSINAVADGSRSTNIHKIGTGTLTLTGGNTDPDATPFATAYTGRTAVEQGTLSISPAVTGSANYLADTADVLLFTGGILNLNIAGETDTIDQLFVNGINVAPGVYGGIGSAAAPGFQLAQITGTGLLNVVGFRLPGDFDNSNTVDAADLAVWRTAAGGANPHLNTSGDTDGDGDSDGNDFLIWQRYLGHTNPAVAAAAAVPEPASALLAASAMLGLVGAARRRK